VSHCVRNATRSFLLCHSHSAFATLTARASSIRPTGTDIAYILDFEKHLHVESSSRSNKTGDIRGHGRGSRFPRPTFASSIRCCSGKNSTPSAPMCVAGSPSLSVLKPTIHRPWEATSDALGRAGVTQGETYPKPIVQRTAARARTGGFRRGAGPVNRRGDFRPISLTCPSQIVTRRSMRRGRQ
jgi:hypothetical protein